MLPKLETLFTTLEEERETVESRLAAATPEQLTFHPAEGGWSLLQVLEHIVMVEESMLTQLSKGERLAEKRSFGEWWKHLLVRAWLAVGLRAKAPSRMKPQEEVDLGQLQERWSTVRAQLQAFMEAADEEELQRFASRHPVAGPLTVQDSLDFLLSHFRHHQKQMGRVRRAVGFPG